MGKIPIKKLRDGKFSYYALGVAESVFTTHDIKVTSDIGGYKKDDIIPAKTSIDTILSKLVGSDEHEESGDDFPDPDSVTDICTVNIPSNIVDGTSMTGVDSYDASTGSMLINDKRVTSFNAKFSPGTHIEAATTINPKVEFNRCVIATELEFYGDCAASGKPITIEFHNCIFDGQSHAKQFLFLQYGSKYIFDGSTISVVDGSAIAKYNVILDNCKFINLSPDKATRALFKGFGSTYDRPDLSAGDHFDPAPSALPQETIMANTNTAEFVTTISGLSKEYKSDHQYEYYDFQAGSYATVTNIKL